MNGGKFQEIRWGGAAGVQTVLQSKVEPRPSADKLFMYSASLAQCLTICSGERVSQGAAEPEPLHCFGSPPCSTPTSVYAIPCFPPFSLLSPLLLVVRSWGGKAEQVGI